MPPPRWTVPLTAAALLCFAANSLLARAALNSGMSPTAFTGIRLAAGALVLLPLLARPPRRVPGSWPGAAALLTYALAFSLAYVRLGVAAGALILFTAVQATMLAWGAFRGQPPSPRALLGMATAFVGLLLLLGPGLARPDPAGAALMALSGAAWGAYTLLGRTEPDAAGATAGHFLRTLPAALLLCALPAARLAEATTPELAEAVASGALASGIGYLVWYKVLPNLRVTQAAAVQLSVPVVAGLGAAALLAEPPTLRLLAAAAIILAGIALAVLPPRLRADP